MMFLLWKPWASRQRWALHRADVLDGCRAAHDLPRPATATACRGLGCRETRRLGDRRGVAAAQLIAE